MERPNRIFEEKFRGGFHKTMEWDLPTSTDEIATVSIKRTFDSTRVVDWSFKINGIEEMCSSGYSSYESAFIECVEGMASKVSNYPISEFNWCIIGGADYQLMKHMKMRDGLRRENVPNTYVMIDPLAGRLQDIYGIVAPRVLDIPSDTEIALTFNQFCNSYGSLYNGKFDAIVMDVSDPANESERGSGLESAAEFYANFNMGKIIQLLKPRGYIIVYEGSNYEHRNTVTSSLLARRDATVESLAQAYAWYGRMSLWQVTKH